MPYEYLVPDLTGLNVEQRISLAIEAIDKSPLLPNGHRQLSQVQASKDFLVKRGTLRARYNGIRPRNEAHEHQQNLTHAEEKILVEWLKVQGRRGVPVGPSTLGDHAAAIAGPNKDIGQSWPHRFMKRHPDLKTKWTQSLEKCRANNVNYATIMNFRDIFEEVVAFFNIPPENMYNMDEKGLQLGVGKRIAAIIDRDQKQVYSLEDGDRELVTVVETVCADGTALNPSFIFKGARTNLEWGRNNPCNARCENIPIL